MLATDEWVHKCLSEVMENGKEAECLETKGRNLLYSNCILWVLLCKIS